jgi:hypothetical protein
MALIKKRSLTSRLLEANRRNSRRSTGPRTPAGRDCRRASRKLTRPDSREGKER